MVQGQVVFSAKDHGADISTDAQDSREPGTTQIPGVEQLTQNDSSSRDRKLRVCFAIVLVNEMGGGLQIVLLILIQRKTRHRVHDSRCCPLPGGGNPRPIERFS